MVFFFTSTGMIGSEPPSPLPARTPYSVQAKHQPQLYGSLVVALFAWSGHCILVVMYLHEKVDVRSTVTLLLDFACTLNAMRTIPSGIGRDF